MLVITVLRRRIKSRSDLVRAAATFLAFRSMDRRITIPTKTFDLSSFDESTCINRFRFSPSEIELLVDMLGVPATVYSKQRVPVSATEAMCVMLRRLSFPCRLSDLAYELTRRSLVVVLPNGAVCLRCSQEEAHV